MLAAWQQGLYKSVPVCQPGPGGHTASSTGPDLAGLDNDWHRVTTGNSVSDTVRRVTLPEILSER